MNYLDIQKPVQPLLRESNKKLNEVIQSDVLLIRRLQQHTPVQKGKKIRSTLLFLLASLTETKAKELDTIGAALEMFHLSSLIHDDIIDNSELRRGERTVNNHFGSYLSVLWGDYLFINSFYLINQTQHQYLIDILVEASQQMIEGQIIEFGNKFNYAVTIRSYLQIIKKKTSVFFEGIAKIVPLLNNQPFEIQRLYMQFGHNFGMVFQIRDDMLDIFSASTGKDRFIDLKEGKITLPYILLLKKKKKSALSVLTQNDPKRILDLFEEYRIETTLQRIIEKYQNRCLAFLNRFPDSLFKGSLIHLVDFIGRRDF